MEKVWIVVSPIGKLCLYTTHWNRSRSIELFLKDWRHKHAWKSDYRKGWRCKKMYLVEI